MSWSSADESESDEDSIITTMRTTARIEDNVNRRAGHIAVAYENSALVWAGYAEPTYDTEQEYWHPGDLYHYSYFHNVWRKLSTKGDIPNRCSGAGACVLNDDLYIVAGFHHVFHPSRSESETEEEDPDQYYIRRIEISNRIWRLNLQTLVWKKLAPSGHPPLCCDKTTCWSYNNKVYVFGGFGAPPLENDAVANKFKFVVDTSIFDGRYLRGWSNQLVAYSSESKSWEWPDTVGAKPSPRAAHSSAVISDKVYIFGGRFKETRLNDLHCLNLSSMTWTTLLLPSNSPPTGRSWQSLSSIYTGLDEGALLLYGGFDNDMTTLNDCWRLDLSKESPSWERQKHLEAGPRLWHAAVNVNQATLMIVGGLTNNILAPEYLTKHHATEVLYLRVSPPSLLSQALEYISRNQTVFEKEISDLPVNLRRILELRASGGA